MGTYSTEYDADPKKAFTYVIEYECGSINRRKLCKYFHPSGVSAGDRVTESDEKRLGYDRQLESAKQKIIAANPNGNPQFIETHRIYSVWADGVEDYCASHVSGPFEIIG